MAAKIGLDTNLVVGLLDEQDVWHAPTRALLAELEAHDLEPVVFDCVLAEAISTLARRTHEKHRAAQLHTLLAQLKAEFPTKSILWLYPEPSNFPPPPSSPASSHSEIASPARRPPRGGSSLLRGKLHESSHRLR